MASVVLACLVLRRPSLPLPRMGKGPSLSFPSSIGTSVRLARTAAPPKPCLPRARHEVGAGAVLVLRPSLPLPRMGKEPSLSFPSSIGTSVRLARTAAPPKPCLPRARHEVGAGAVHPLRFSFSSTEGVGLEAPHPDDDGTGTGNDCGSEVMFFCEICAKCKRKIACFSFTDQLWKRCQEEHPKDAFFRCDGYRNGFKNKGKHRRHRRHCHHTKEEDVFSCGAYCCEICDQREGKRECFRSADELWRHCRKAHCGEANVRCYGCGNGYVDKWHLQRHKRRCEHKYTKGKLPKYHFRTYVCYVRGKWFKDKEKCRRHSRRCCA